MCLCLKESASSFLPKDKSSKRIDSFKVSKANCYITLPIRFVHLVFVLYFYNPYA